MKKLILSFATLFVAATMQAQMTPIPADPDVRVGRLENGMTYYIRHNEKPAGQADFYILHNVGAIQENDSQQGLAHFLEHMAFNGTKNLPDKMLIEYLEKIGVKFGYNLNAYTSWDKTCYMVKDVPVVREGVIDTALTILHDWSSFISLEAEEMDKERGVIMEELRTRDGASWRGQIEMIKALGRGTKYEHRNLIGYLDGLKSFSHTELRDFYHTWYRPDYQGLVVVGDIDVDAVEAKIKALMRDIPAPAADAPVKEVITVPANTEPIISIYADPETQYSMFRIFMKRDALPKEYNNTVIYETLNIIASLADAMENERLHDISMQPDAPFVQAEMGNGSVGLIPTLNATIFVALAQEGRLAEAFATVLVEAEKVRRYGFTQSEFDRAKENLLRSFERAYNNRNDRTNNEYVDIYLNAFEKNTPMPDAQTEYELDKALLEQITLEAVNEVCREWVNTESNMVVTIDTPVKDGVEIPTEEMVSQIIAAVRAAEIAPYEDATVKEPLIGADVTLKGSKVKKAAENTVLGTTEWTLKNGIKVVVKPSTLKADEVLLSVTGKGGSSIVSDEEYYTAQLLPVILQMSGVSKFSATDLRKQLSGKTASVYLSVDEYEHGMGGSCSPKDIETMLQLLYLNFTQPRFNEDDFNTMVKTYVQYVQNLATNPDYIVEEEISKTLYNDNFRRRELSVEMLQSMKFASLPSIFETLYTDADEFLFTIVGNVDLATLKPLVEKYIGSLPVNKKHHMTFVDDGVRPVLGNVVRDFTTPMQQPKVSVNRIFTGTMLYSLENRVKMNFLEAALDVRYLESLREEKGGTYGAQISCENKHLPVDSYLIRVSFDTNEAMADELSEIVIEELRRIAAEGPKSEDIEKNREFLLKNFRNAQTQNRAWLSWINRYYDEATDYISNYEKIVESVTDADIQALAKKILADENMTCVVMRPAK